MAPQVTRLALAQMQSEVTAQAELLEHVGGALGDFAEKSGKTWGSQMKAKLVIITEIIMVYDTYN